MKRSFIASIAVVVMLGFAGVLHAQQAPQQDLIPQQMLNRPSDSNLNMRAETYKAQRNQAMDELGILNGVIVDLRTENLKLIDENNKLKEQVKALQPKDGAKK